MNDFSPVISFNCFSFVFDNLERTGTVLSKFKIAFYFERVFSPSVLLWFFLITFIKSSRLITAKKVSWSAIAFSLRTWHSASWLVVVSSSNQPKQPPLCKCCLSTYHWNIRNLCNTSSRYFSALESSINCSQSKFYFSLYDHFLISCDRQYFMISSFSLVGSCRLSSSLFYSSSFLTDCMYDILVESISLMCASTIILFTWAGWSIFVAFNFCNCFTLVSSFICRSR